MTAPRAVNTMPLVVVGVVNEIFRRVDPFGRTLGEFLQQDINEPLGVEARVGLGKDELSRGT